MSFVIGQSNLQCTETALSVIPPRSNVNSLIVFILSVLFTCHCSVKVVPLELRVDKYRYHISDVIDNGVDVKISILAGNVNCFDAFQYCVPRLLTGDKKWI